MSDEIPTHIRAEFERRGVDSIRALLVSMTSSGQTGGSSANALVGLGSGIDAARWQMEDWLQEMDAAAQARQEERHAQVIRVSYCTLAVAVLAAAAGIVAAWPVLKAWIR